MKDKETLQKILDKKTESLKGLCDTLDGAAEWFEIYCKAGYDPALRDDFFKTITAFADTYRRYTDTLQAIKVLKFILDIPEQEC